MQSKPLKVLALTAMVMLLAGCGVPNSQEPLVSDIEDLRLAFEGAGGECLNWEPRDVTEALESGACNEGTVLMVFSSAEEAHERARWLRDYALRNGYKPSLLLGGNWLINSKNDARLAQASMGGLLVTE